MKFFLKWFIALTSISFLLGCSGTKNVDEIDTESDDLHFELDITHDIKKNYLDDEDVEVGETRSHLELDFTFTVKNNDPDSSNGFDYIDADEPGEILLNIGEAEYDLFEYQTRPLFGLSSAVIAYEIELINPSFAGESAKLILNTPNGSVEASFNIPHLSSAETNLNSDYTPITDDIVISTDSGYMGNISLTQDGGFSEPCSSYNQTDPITSGSFVIPATSFCALGEQATLYVDLRESQSYEATYSEFDRTELSFIEHFYQILILNP